MIALLKTIWKSVFAIQQKTPAKRDSDGTQWCLVGNIVQVQKCSPCDSETRRGSKHFAPGTKVFCLPAQWGDAYDRIVVIGRHRGSKRFVTMVISSDMLTNWRAKVVHDPAVLNLLAKIETEQGRSNWKTKDEVDQYVSLLTNRPLK